MQSILFPYRIIKKGLNTFYVSNVFWSVFMVATVGSLFTGMMRSLSMTNAQIAQVQAIGQLMIPGQIIGAVLQKHYFHRKKFWVSALVLHNVMFALIAALILVWAKLPASVAVMLFFVCFGVASIGFQMHRSVQLAWQNEFVPESESNSFWSKITAVGMVAMVVAGFALGAAADVMGRDRAFTYFVILSAGVVAATISLAMNARVPDPNPAPQPDGDFLKNVRLVFRDKNFRRLCSSFSLNAIANWFTSALIFVQLQSTMAFSMVEIQVFSATSCASAFAASKLFDVIGRRYGRKPILMICTVVKALEFLLWGLLRPGNNWLDNVVGGVVTGLFGEGAALSTGFAGALPIFILGGFVNVGIASMQLAFLRDLGPRGNQSLSISLFFAISGVAGGLTAMLSGRLDKLLSAVAHGGGSFEAFMTQFNLVPFNLLAFGSAVLFLVCAFVVKTLKEDGAAPTLHVVRMLLENNPFRSVYQTQMLSRPLSEAARMDVMNNASSRLVQPELVRNLYSSSSRVRDGAMQSIAKIGRNKLVLDDAVAQSLIALLGMPELGLRAEAARALGRCRCKAAIPNLVALFDYPDSELASAAIFAAGLMGEKSVIPDMANVMASAKNGEAEKAAAAEAVSRFGEHTDAKLIFGVFEQCTNPILRIQSLVSVCRSMCDTHHAHKLFEEEERRPGTQINALLSAISLRIKGKLLNVDDLMTKFDAGALQDIATEIVSPAVAFCLPLDIPEGQSDSDFLKSLFAESGKFKDERLDNDDYVATGLWLQLRLWAYLEYGATDRDAYVLLAILYLSDRLWRRLDPAHIRRPDATTAPAVAEYQI